MKRMITILYLNTVLSVLIFILFTNTAFAQAYKTIKDIMLDGKDAVGKKASLCVFISSIRDTQIDVWDEEGSKWMAINRDSKKKELIKRITTDFDRCTEVTVKILDVFNWPVAEMISVEKTRSKRK